MESGAWIRSSGLRALRHSVVSTSLAAAAFTVGCGSPIYSAAPINGTVVDAETRSPIEGAIVVANWQLVEGSLDGERVQGQLEVKETVTDRDGRFHFDGFTKLNCRMHELRGSDPRVIVFKGGYDYVRIANSYPRAGTQTPGMFRKAAADGQTIALRRASPVDVNGRPAFYGHLNTELMDLTRDARQCEWKNIPRLILAMDGERRRVLKQSPDAFVRLIGKDDINNYAGSKCGSVSAFFAEYEQ